MIFPVILFPSGLKKNSHPGGLPLFSILGFLVILCFLILAQKIVRTKPGSSVDKKYTPGFRQLLLSPKPYPISKEVSVPPSLTAKSVIVTDADSAVVLYQKDPDLKLLPASTTKMMTAIIALENYQLDKVLTVGETKVNGNKVKLLSGEKITVENLLYALLVGSANDAAQVLAENFPGGEEAFVSAMNKKALDLKLENTNFTNPMGLDDENHYSTARDLARLAITVIKNPLLARIVSTPEITITDVSGAAKHQLRNTNELIGKIEGVRGVKTGWTQNAGGCLVSWIEKADHKVVMVVLDSQDRFEETRSLIDWVFNNFEWKIIAPTNSH